MSNLDQSLAMYGDRYDRLVTPSGVVGGGVIAFQAGRFPLTALYFISDHKTF